MELGRNPVSKHQIQPEYGDEQADTGRDCRTRLARPNSQARTRTGKYSFFAFQLTTCRTGNLTRLIHTLAYMCDHTMYTIYIKPRGGKKRLTRLDIARRREKQRDWETCYRRRECRILQSHTHWPSRRAEEIFVRTRDRPRPA